MWFFLKKNSFTYYATLSYWSKKYPCLLLILHVYILTDRSKQRHKFRRKIFSEKKKLDNLSTSYNSLCSETGSQQLLPEHLESGEWPWQLPAGGLLPLCCTCAYCLISNRRYDNQEQIKQKGNKLFFCILNGHAFSTDLNSPISWRLIA